MPHYYTTEAWATFSCVPRYKFPSTPHGVHDAAIGYDIPDGDNVAIACGQASGLTVLDVDTKSGGPATLARLLATYGKPPPTPMARTPSGGLHVYWAYCRTGNRAGILPGLDVRDDGGYVLAPPSELDNGRYEWLPGRSPCEVSVQPAPQWFRLLCLGTSKPANSNRTRSHGEWRPLDPDRVQPVGEGSRNDRLYRWVRRMIHEGRDASAISDAAHYLNQHRVTPPLPDREVDYLVRMAVRRHAG
jgi:hypothetical protein